MTNDTIKAARELVKYINETASQKEISCKNVPNGFFAKVSALETALAKLSEGVDVETIFDGFRVVPNELSETDIREILYDVNRRYDKRTLDEYYLKQIYSSSLFCASKTYTVLNQLQGLLAGKSEWMPIETVPDNGEYLCYWPAVKLDEDGDLTDIICTENKGFTGVGARLGGQWNGEPDSLNATGEWFGDDYAYAPEPTYWMPLPAAPKLKGNDDVVMEKPPS